MTDAERYANVKPSNFNVVRAKLKTMKEQMEEFSNLPEDVLDYINLINLRDYDLSVGELIDENKRLKSELRAFFTGNAPQNATMTEIILAQWGRKRIAGMSEKD